MIAGGVGVIAKFLNIIKVIFDEDSHVPPLMPRLRE